MISDHDDGIVFPADNDNCAKPDNDIGEPPQPFIKRSLQELAYLFHSKGVTNQKTISSYDENGVLISCSTEPQ